MKSLLSKKLIIPIVALAALGGAAGAVAATQSSTAPDAQAQAYINDLAGRLNVTPDALTAAMKAALDDQIDAAVTAGRLTQAQADALKLRVASGDGLRFLGIGHAGGGLGAALPRHGIVAAGLDVAAQYLGISTTTLRTDLESGKSLAAIASSTAGKSTDGLKATLLAAAKTRLDQAVTNGRITSAEEQTILTALSTNIDALLQRTWNGAGAGMGPLHRLGGHGLGLRRAGLGGLFG